MYRRLFAPLLIALLTLTAVVAAIGEVGAPVESRVFRLPNDYTLTLPRNWSFEETDEGFFLLSNIDAIVDLYTPAQFPDILTADDDGDLAQLMRDFYEYSFNLTINPDDVRVLTDASTGLTYAQLIYREDEEEINVTLLVKISDGYALADMFVLPEVFDREVAGMLAVIDTLRAPDAADAPDSVPETYTVAVDEDYQMDLPAAWAIDSIDDVPIFYSGLMRAWVYTPAYYADTITFSAEDDPVEALALFSGRLFGISVRLADILPIGDDRAAYLYAELSDDEDTNITYAIQTAGGYVFVDAYLPTPDREAAEAQLLTLLDTLMPVE